MGNGTSLDANARRLCEARPRDGVRGSYGCPLGTEWNGMERNEMEWGGMEWNGTYSAMESLSPSRLLKALRFAATRRGRISSQRLATG